jgi:teichuronic acid biosynthesis glycosyltransferase TuaC
VGGSDVLLLPKLAGRGREVTRVLRESDAVLTVSEGLRSAVIALGIAAERVHTVYQGVTPETFHPGDQAAEKESLGLTAGRPVILWVGRMVGLKRLDLLLHACGILRDRRADFELCLVGDGEVRPTIEAETRAAGLSDVVRFVGSVPYRTTASWYRAADVTVICSDSEGLPNVLRESLACGTPFVATDVGSIREIADEGVAVLTPPGDAGALADAIATVLVGGHRARARSYAPRTWADTAVEVAAILEASAVAVDRPAQLEYT